MFIVFFGSSLLYLCLQLLVYFDLEIFVGNSATHQAFRSLFEERSDTLNAEGVLAGQCTRLYHRLVTYDTISLEFLSQTLSSEWFLLLCDILFRLILVCRSPLSLLVLNSQLAYERSRLSDDLNAFDFLSDCHRR